MFSNSYIEESKIDEFKALLNSNELEEVYQKFLEGNSQFIPREFVQNHGIHCDVVFRKLKLAENYVTDFLYLSKSSADWNIVFIELEKPSTPYFEKNSDNFHKEFMTGLNQIDRWRAWIDTTGNLEHMVNETLDPMLNPIGMKSNKKFIKYILVTGRRSEFESDTRKRSLITAKEQKEDFKILSYDSLIEGARHNRPLYVSARFNSHIKILTNDFITENAFVWINPERIEISKQLYDNALAQRDRWRFIGTSLGTKKLDSTLARVKVS